MGHDSFVFLDFGEDPWFYALHRTIETVLGIGMAILVSLVPKLIPMHKPNRQHS